MVMANWLAQERTLSPVAMTVKAQAIDPRNLGTLRWPTFFPRKPVPSVDLQYITSVDYRPVSDRREWNARGRRIPGVTPTVRPVSIVPVEGNDRIDEKEMQRLTEAVGTNQEQFRELAGVSVPARVNRIAEANLRRIEVDAMNAWALGAVTQRMPEDASKTVSISLNFSGARYVTAGTAWNDPGVNAYDLFLAAIAAARLKIGAVAGAMMRQATFDAILADAPDLPGGVLMTQDAFLTRLRQDLTTPFTIIINEDTVDVFDDGGLTTTAANIWPAQRVAFIPAGTAIGETVFAPVRRAVDLVASVGSSPGIDVRGQTVYYEDLNGGRELGIEVQVNAMSVPDEQKVYVLNVGV